MKFIERENEIIKTVRKLSGFKIIVVGGYAVSARARHRFSVDCDFVISKKDLNKISSALVEQGYEKSIAKKGFDPEYGGEFVRYVKKLGDLPVSADLLIGSLVSRTTSASWSFDYILKNSTKSIITGVQDSVECLVPSKELLLAFKIHSGRKTDLRDIIVLRDADWGVVVGHTARGDIGKLKKGIEIMLAGLESRNLVDSLKGVFGFGGGVDRAIRSTKKKLTSLLIKL